jgi:hypothetical protein
MHIDMNEVVPVKCDSEGNVLVFYTTVEAC